MNETRRWVLVIGLIVTGVAIITQMALGKPYHAEKQTASIHEKNIEALDLAETIIR